MGVILSDNLKWNVHIVEIVRKANKWLFFLTLDKCLPNREDLVHTYTSLINYACPVCHAGLSQYLQTEVETIQRRHLTTIYGLAQYEENLCASALVSLKDRHVKICSDLFKEICKLDYKLNHLIPKPCECSNPCKMTHQLITNCSAEEILSFHMF